MPDELQKVRSAKTQQRKKKEQASLKGKGTFSSRQLKEAYAHLPTELQSFIHELFENRAELEKENEQLRLSRANLQVAHEWSRCMLDAAAVGLLALNKKGIVLESNIAAARLFGQKLSDLTGRQLKNCLHPDDCTTYAAHIKHLWSKGTPQSCEIRIMTGDQIAVPMRMDSILSGGRNPGSIHLVTISGIAGQKEAELKQDLATDVLRVLNRGSGDMTQLIREVLRLINESIGFGAVGLRLHQGDDYPYYEQNGFSEDFICNENFLCSKKKDGAIVRDLNGQPVLECACGLVLSGKTDPSKPLFTEGGSFWTNNASELLSIPMSEDPRINPRNQCIHNGYKSVALIPVHSSQEVIGLLQLNDRRENRLSRELVRFFEGLGDQIGLTQAEDALRQKQQDLNRAQAVGQIGSWRLDLENNILTWSDENYRLFGISKEKAMTYETFLSAVHKDDRRYVDTMWKAALHGDPYDIEHRIQLNGEVKWVREKAYLEFDNKGNLMGAFGITQDITSRRQAEEELRILNESLEHRVAERSVVAEYRAEQLQKLTLELTLAEQRERQRLAMVLHDGLQQILVGSKIQLAFIERSKDIHLAVEQVSELIDDAIETSRSLTAELSPPILLQGDLVLAFEWLVRWMHRKYGLAVRLIARKKIKPLAEEISLLLFQSLRELLFNVVKHAGVKAATVRIHERNGRIEATVTDKGQGFDPSSLRAEGGQSEGIGLFGIRERLTYFGGRMEIDSSPGKGSCFKMTLPTSIILAESRSSATKQEREVDNTDSQVQPKTAVATKKIRVLLVDDHIVMRQGLSRLLRGESDIEVIEETSDGESAVRLIRELSPDVVLMDINMPGMDGIEAAQIIHKELPEIRIIGLSMFQEDERADAMRKAGAVDYITKSGPSDAVIDAIRNSIGFESNRPR